MKISPWRILFYTSLIMVCVLIGKSIAYEPTLRQWASGSPRAL